MSTTDDDLEPGPDTDADGLPSPVGSSAPPINLEIPRSPLVPSEMTTLRPSELPPHPTDAQQFAAIMGNLLAPITRKLESVHAKLDAMSDEQDKHERHQLADWRLLTAEVKGLREQLRQMEVRFDEHITRVNGRLDELETRVTALEDGRAE